MSPDEIDKLTIAEVRAIVERAESALATLKSLGLMGGAAGVQPAQAQPHAPVVSPVPGPPTRAGFFGGQPSEAELADMRARKAALVSLNRPDDLPEEIKRAEGIK